MRRRTLLGTCAMLGAATSGCSSIGAPETMNETTHDRSIEGATVVEYVGDRLDRPACRIAEQTVTYSDETYDVHGTVAYPDPPDLDDGNLVAYVKAFDEALMTNLTLCEAYRGSWSLRWDTTYIRHGCSICSIIWR